MFLPSVQKVKTHKPSPNFTETMTTRLVWPTTPCPQSAEENKGKNKSHKTGHTFFVFQMIWLISHGIKGHHWPFQVGISFFPSSRCFSKAGFMLLSLCNKFGRQLGWPSSVFPIVAHMRKVSPGKPGKVSVWATCQSWKWLPMF